MKANKSKEEKYVLSHKGDEGIIICICCWMIKKGEKKSSTSILKNHAKDCKKKYDKSKAYDRLNILDAMLISSKVNDDEESIITVLNQGPGRKETGLNITRNGEEGPGLTVRPTLHIGKNTQENGHFWQRVPLERNSMSSRIVLNSWKKSSDCFDFLGKDLRGFMNHGI
eukprot:Pgem_evm2s7901